MKCLRVIAELSIKNEEQTSTPDPPIDRDTSTSNSSSMVRLSHEARKTADASSGQRPSGMSLERTGAFTLACVALSLGVALAMVLPT